MIIRGSVTNHKFIQLREYAHLTFPGYFSNVVPASTTVDNYGLTPCGTNAPCPVPEASIGYTGTKGNYHFTTEECSECSYTWIFGDGTSGTGVVIDHTYFSSGDFTVILIISNECSSDTAYQLIHIELPCPNPDIDLISPNPCNDRLFIESSFCEEVDGDFIVYDELGQVVRKKENIPKSMMLSEWIKTNDLAEGTYIILFNLKGVQRIRKFEVIR
jgi:hypothetical protein